MTSQIHAQQDLAALQVAAEAGDPQAQYRLAEVYRRGEGVPQNSAEFKLWGDI